MSICFNLDVAIQSLKTITDCNRCVICDKLEGDRLRYLCGHTVCGDCVADCCLLCLSPQTAGQQPAHDFSSTQRSENASNLLKKFESVFNVDIQRRSRVSELEKIEKSLFPACIQAQQKYSNKAKNSRTPSKILEKKSFLFSGEDTSAVKILKMDRSNYVENWLNKNEQSLKKNKRKPLGTLDANSPLKRSFRPIRKRADVILDRVYEKKKLTKSKRSHWKTSSPATEAKPDLKSLKTKNYVADTIFNNSVALCDNAKESNFLNETIVIEDSQSQVIDKDKEAWLAVIEADKHQVSDCSILRPENKQKNDENSIPICKTSKEGISMNECRVPFLKKSSLREVCRLCDSEETVNSSKDFSLTIESKSFVTTVKVSTVAPGSRVLNKQSIPVQTEIKAILDDKQNSGQENEIEIIESNKEIFTHCIENSKLEIGESQELFTDEVPMVNEDSLCQFKEENETRKRKHVTIADSDSDESVSHSKVLQVKADVHRSSDQYDFGVLTEMDPKDPVLQCRPGNRAITPSSTNSSEKENYNPNKLKKVKPKQKKKRRN